MSNFSFPRPREAAPVRHREDVGGTFTDVVAVQNGRVLTTKVSTNVRQVETGVVVRDDPEFDPEGLTIDVAATRALRGERA